TAGVTFAMYEIFGRQIGAEVVKTPSPTHKMEQFLELYKKYRPELIFICTPNNPIGEAVDRREVEWFLDGIGEETFVVIDGAYQEFAQFKDSKKGIPPKSLIHRPNLLYTGTFSKAYGLGGARVGYGIGNREVIKALEKLRPPFNISSLSYWAAVEALRHWEWVQSYLKLNFQEMERYQQLADRLGFRFEPSYTNFILIYFHRPEELYHHLFRRGIILRNMGSYGLPALRITIGKPEENSRVIEEIERFYRRG
ncbi:MAG: aminotransferase class I/II-fold pyridoxal phosphate-dependent enzyme, partial [Campylobacterales bacterium]